MATYKVKMRSTGVEGQRSSSKTKQVQASSWSEAKKATQSDAVKLRNYVSARQSDGQKTPRISYSGSTVTTQSKSAKTGISKKVTTSVAQSGKLIKEQSFTKSFRAKPSSGRVVGANPARRTGGGAKYKLPDILSLRDM